MAGHEQKAIQTTYLSIAGNAGLAIIKGITGYLGNSYALIADALESTSDIFSSVLVLFGLKYASRPADKNHPYGHGRAEPLITFLVVCFLVASAVIIAVQSIEKIQTPHGLPEAYTLAVLGVIILIKEIFYRVVMHRAKRTNSSSLKADAWHHRSDAITSVTAFIGISIALIGGKGYETADDWAALAAAGIILFNSYHILRPALGEIMDEQMYDSLVTDIRSKAQEVPGIIDTEKCLVRKTGMTYFVDLHAVVSGSISVKEGHELAHRLKRHLQEQLPELANILIHIEPDQ
jgi:cation diffusion facilitator family transporter